MVYIKKKKFKCSRKLNKFRFSKNKKIKKKSEKNGRRYLISKKYNLKGGFNNIQAKSNYCSPHNNEKAVSCFSKESLIKIANSWNKYFPNDKIDYNNTISKSGLWNKINQRLKNECDSEYCWLNRNFMKSNKELKSNFRPEMPTSWRSNKNEWLTSIDIEKVMKQYQNKYNDFLFIGPVPIDFDKKLHPGMCVVNELCDIKLSSLLKKNINKLGIIFNLDTHDQPGSHWVAFFGDLNGGTLNYFDSYGFKEPKEVTILMKRLSEQGSSNNIRFKSNINSTRHQYKNSECGVYCLNFIIKMLEGKSFDELANTKISDDEMEQNRNILFVKQ